LADASIQLQETTTDSYCTHSVIFLLLLLLMMTTTLLLACIAGSHIRLMLPMLRRQISDTLEARQAELRGYGPALDLDSEGARCALLLPLCLPLLHAFLMTERIKRPPEESLSPKTLRTPSLQIAHSPHATHTNPMCDLATRNCDLVTRNTAAWTATDLLCTHYCSGAALLQMLCSYAERFGALLQGHSEDMPLSELMGGARIRHIFQVCMLACVHTRLCISQAVGNCVSSWHIP
jgi:hypothetical protein